MASTPEGAKPAKTKPRQPAARKKAAGVAASEKRPHGGQRLPHAAEIKRALCEWLERGETLAAFLRQTPNAPGRSTIAEWLDEDAEFAGRYARAREIGHDAIAEELLTIVDSEPERDAAGKIDPGSVAQQRLQADTRRWLLSKWQPKRYGDKIEATHQGPNGGPIQMQNTVTFVAAPAPARAEDEDE